VDICLNHTEKLSYCRDALELRIWCLERSEACLKFGRLLLRILPMCGPFLMRGAPVNTCFCGGTGLEVVWNQGFEAIPSLFVLIDSPVLMGSYLGLSESQAITLERCMPLIPPCESASDYRGCYGILHCPTLLRHLSDKKEK